VILIESVVSVDAPSLNAKTRDTLPLTWEGRRWTRRKAHTKAGREIALAFPTGTVLALGAILWVADDWYLQVDGAPEPVIAVYPGSHAEALRVCFEVGNRHFSVALDGERLLVPDDTAMVQLLERLGARWEKGEAVYTPMGFGHTHAPDVHGEARIHDHGHEHTHGHAHDHAHDHAHGHPRSHGR
jgi:urease accessory protein